jgi:hypothetical protein
LRLADEPVNLIVRQADECGHAKQFGFVDHYTLLKY